MLHKILVIEDDLDIQGFAKTVLENAGFAVEACSTAADAIKLFHAGSPDLVIIDIGLPDGSGLEVCRQLGLGGKSRVPFVFLTAQNELNTRLEAFKIGAQDYIQKPFAVEELLARVKVHMKVKKSQDDLARRNYDLELINRVRQDLTDMIVHDLKTPLTSIKGTLDLIKMRGLISAPAANLVDTAGTAADFMLLMLNDLLDIGHSEATGLPVAVAEFPLPAMIEKLRHLFESRAQRAEIPLSFSVADGLDGVMSDQNLLFRIAVNLIANAMKASPRGKSVEIGVRRHDGSLRLMVADRGPGVADASKTSIFEKYHTTDLKSFLEDGGSGIGLSFCRIAVNSLKGRVWVEDRPGGGSLFLVEVPEPGVPA
jgi:two-component system, sensor histidine kinase and response regulator